MSTQEKRIKIYRGADKTFLVRLINTKSGDPYDLSSFDYVQVVFLLKSRKKLILTTDTVPAVKAQADKDGVTFIAQNGGAQGNSITLNFNGVDDIDTVVNAWNTANPSNLVTHNGNGTDVLSAETVVLSNGYDSYQPVQVWGDPKYGKVLVTLLESQTINLRAGTSQSFTVIIDNGINPGGFRNIGVFEQGVDVFEAY
jgi:hypothetical protein